MKHHKIELPKNTAKIHSLENLSPNKMKLLARLTIWKLTALPSPMATELNKETRQSEQYWFNTSGAAFYCHCKTGDSAVDWHSKLMENRRDQNDMCSVLCFGSPPRGNVEQLGELRCFKYKRKVYYTAHDLDVWLSGLEDKKLYWRKT